MAPSNRSTQDQRKACDSPRTQKNSQESQNYLTNQQKPDQFNPQKSLEIIKFQFKILFIVYPHIDRYIKVKQS